MALKQMKRCRSESSYVSLPDTSKQSFMTRSEAWSLYFNWRKNDIERTMYMNENVKYRELCAIVDLIPCKTHRKVWRKFIRSDDTVDKLRIDTAFTNTMRQLITAVHYDAIRFMADNLSKTPLKNKIKGFIFPRK